MKNRKKLWIIIVFIIVVSNIPPFTGIFRLFLDQKHYRYSNFDGSNTSYEFMSRGFEMMKAMNKGCLSHHPNQKDKKLYRLFSKNPLAFWRWASYFYDDRYELPYKDWKEIERKRTVTEATQGCSIEF